MSKESYARGFAKVATAHGVDPVQLIKFALSDSKRKPSKRKPKDLSPADGASMGAAAGGAASLVGAPFAFNFGDKLKSKANIIEDGAFSRLKSTDPQYKSLYLKHSPALDAANEARGKLHDLRFDLGVANELRNRNAVEKSIMTAKEERLLHPIRYNNLVNDGKKLDAEIQRMQNVESKIMDDINAHVESAKPLTDRSAELRRMAGKKIGPRMVRAGGRIAPWIGLLLPPIVGGLVGSAASRRKDQNPKK